MMKVFSLKTSRLITWIIGISLVLIITASAHQQWQASPSLITKPGVKSIISKVQVQRNDLVRIQYSVPDPLFKNVEYQNFAKKPAMRCILGNAYFTDEAGAPKIPYITARVILAPGQTIQDVKIIPEKVVELEQSYVLAYSELQQPAIPGAKVIWSKPQSAIYNSDNPYPEKNCKPISIQGRNGVSIALVNIYPLTYYPLSGKIKYYKEFTLELTSKPDLNVGSGVRVDKERIRNHGITEENLEALDYYVDGSINGPYDNVLCNPKEDYDYLVITNKDIINSTGEGSLNKLIELRTKQGLKCKTQDIDEVLRSYKAAATPDQLRKFIKDAYNNWNVKFVLLGGDIDIIPLMTKPVRGTQIPTDLPYQCLDGDNWNDDFQAELLIGRFSASSVTEFCNQAYKTIKYETEPNNEPSLRGLLGLAEDLDSRTPTGPAMTKIHNIFDEETFYDSLYDEDGKWSKTKLIDKINTDKFTNVVHMGHANYNYGMRLNNGDESKMKNTKFSFAKSGGCMHGGFDRPTDCLAEHITVYSRTGMFAVILNARYGYYSPGNSTGGSSNDLHYTFWEGCWDEDQEYYSEFNDYSHRIWGTKHTWDVLETNLLGDPAVKFRGKDNSPFISVVYPNGGEMIELSTTQDIRWRDNINGNVKIELFKGSTVKEVLAASIASNGSFEWKIPAGYQVGADYKIKITSIDSAALFVQSTSNFSIITEYILPCPYKQTFDTLETGKSVLPVKWEQDTTDDFDWLVWKGKAPSKEPDQGAATGPDGDRLGSGNYIYVESSASPYNGNPNKKVEFTTPKFSLKKHKNPYLKFWYHMFSDNEGKDEMGDLYLDICVDGSWKNDVFHVNKNQGDKWIEKVVDLNSYKGDRVLLRFRAVTGSGWASDICLDDIEVGSEGVAIQSTVKYPSSYNLKYAASQIHFQIPEIAGKNKVVVKLYNVQGKLVRLLVNNTMGAGNYSVPLQNIASGLYFVTMKVKDYKKIMNITITQ